MVCRPSRWLFLTPDAMSDTAASSRYDLDIPTGSWLNGDKANNHYTVEDVLPEAGVELLSIRYNISHRVVPAFFTFLQAFVRKMVETTGSLFERLLPKSIYGVIDCGLELKVAPFVLAAPI